MITRDGHAQAVNV